jgi:HK97 family phage portal protein
MRIPFTDLYIGKIEKNESLPAGVARPVAIDSIFSAMKSNAGTEYKISVHSLYAIYRMNSDIRNCVREIQQGVGKSGYNLVNPDDPTIEPSPSQWNQLQSVLNSESSTHKSWKDLLSRTVRDIEIAGNAYWVKLKNAGGQVLGFQPVDPRTMVIIAQPTGEIVQYIQKMNETKVREYDPEDIVHFKGEDDPVNEVFGMGKLEPIIWEARTDNAAMISNYKFFENNAIPSALYILDEKIPKETLKAKMAEIKEAYGGADNYKKVAGLIGVKDVKMLNISQKDMDFLAGRKFSTEKICASFGVPKFMLGYTDTVNNNNGTELEKNFYEKTILPIEQNIQSTINQQYLSMTDLSDWQFVFEENLFNNPKETEERARLMYESGMMTLRQVKRMLGEEITPEDEDEINFDKYIVHRGAGAVLLEDIGNDPILDMNEET